MSPKNIRSINLEKIVNNGIREVMSGDLPEIIDLVHRVIRESYLNYYPPEAIDYFIEYHSPENIESDTRNGYTIIILKNNVIIGTGTLLGKNVRRVFILPECQGMGFGKMVMDSLEAEARRCGFAYLDLHASLPAKRFYDSRMYKTFKFCRLPVKGNQTLDYYRMAKTLQSMQPPTVVNLNGKMFKVIQNSGPGAQVNEKTRFIFYQCHELIYAEYEGGEVKEGEMIGYIDGDKITFHYEQTDIRGEKSAGNSIDTVIFCNNGKVRLVDTWKWETKDGEGHCILEEE